MPFLSGPLAARIAFALSRVIVPLWILAGASFKLYYTSPKNLPPGILKAASNHIDLYILLLILIGLEFFAIGVMLFLGRLARIMAAFMLGSFLLILFNEMRLGNFENCGCFGDLEVSPWLTLSIDAILFLGVLFCKPSSTTSPQTRWLPPLGLALAAIWTGIGAGVAAGRILPQREPITIIEEPVTPNDGSGGTAVDTPQPNPPPQLVQLPSYYYLRDSDAWVDQRFQDVDLFGFIKNWPQDLNQGRRYVIFYSRTCDHCETLLNEYFSGQSPVPTVIVAIPEHKSGFEQSGVLPMSCLECTELELPVGCEWMITTPIVVALENGVVVCAVEGEDPEDPACLRWHTGLPGG